MCPFPVLTGTSASPLYSSAPSPQDRQRDTSQAHLPECLTPPASPKEASPLQGYILLTPFRGPG